MAFSRMRLCSVVSNCLPRGTRRSFSFASPSGTGLPAIVMAVAAGPRPAIAAACARSSNPASRAAMPPVAPPRPVAAPCRARGCPSRPEMSPGHQALRFGRLFRHARTLTEHPPSSGKDTFVHTRPGRFIGFRHRSTKCYAMRARGGRRIPKRVLTSAVQRPDVVTFFGM